ncbi:MAG: glutamine--fructose-6-phosphate transaminase (isomerizing) [Clostridia bacterium]
MCGIVGYAGANPALPFLLEGLARLEYRGYDSAGVALVEPSGVYVEKTAGRLSALVAVVDMTRPAQVGIGHTRWATHGPPTNDNAHPHTDCTGRIAAIHNGIIENYRELRAELEAEGHVFASETDTEVIPHLLEAEHGLSLRDAALNARRRLEGAYAFLAVSADEPKSVVAVRQASPLVLGLGSGANYLASDITALLPYTREVLILDNGEMAIISDEAVEIRGARGEVVHRDPLHIDWSAEEASRGGYAHFMLKEIMEQPDAWADCLRGRVGSEGQVLLDELGLERGDLARVERLQLIAAGTAYHACLLAQRWIEEWARVPVRVDVASEFRYQKPILSPGTVVVAVSQSGETADTLAGVALAKQAGFPVWAVTNVVGSTLAREAHRVLYTRAGPEVAVCSTKAYTTQLIVLALLGDVLAAITNPNYDSVVPALQGLPALGDGWLSAHRDLAPAVERVAARPSVFYIGRGVDYAIALEGQLKLKEISYIHAEAYPAGELKHGTLALIEPEVPVVAVVSSDTLFAKVRSNIMEVRARGGSVITVAPESLCSELSDLAEVRVSIPTADPRVTPMLAALPLQLLAYDVAVALGRDVDKPRNLAKSVTVE